MLIVLKNLLENCLEKTIDAFVPIGRHVNFFIYAKTDLFDPWILGLFCQGGLEKITDMA